MLVDLQEGVRADQGEMGDDGEPQGGTRQGRWEVEQVVGVVRDQLDAVVDVVDGAGRLLE